MTADELRHLILYDPFTGFFFRNGVRCDKIKSDGYAYINLRGHRYLAHRLAWLYVTGEWPTSNIDHKNRKRSDNRWNNLRVADHSANGANSGVPKSNTSGFKGVSFCNREQKWRAYIKVQRRYISLGYFDSPENAADHYKAAAERYFGVFARSV